MDRENTSEFAILALEVIGRSGSVAAAILDQQPTGNGIGTDARDGWRWLHRETFASDLRSAAAIGPAIERCLESFSSRQLNAVAVASGPGSFTGLRVAVTAAKSIAYAARVPLTGVDSLAAIASVTPCVEQHRDAKLIVGLSAYRRQVFYRRFRQDHSCWKPIQESELASPEQWLSILESTQEQTLFAGDASVFRIVDAPAESLTKPIHPIACGVVIAARDSLFDLLSNESSPTESAMGLTPNYFRPSAAEEA